MQFSQPLECESIQRELASRGAHFAVDVVASCGSTNSVLLEQAFESAVLPRLLAAETQTAGRGRRGRRWFASPGAGLTFSVLWCFAGDAGRLRGLSLAVGVALARTLRGLGAQAVGLKWPNDLLGDGAKLGGVLVETRSQQGRVAAVIGIGVNVYAMPRLEARLRRRLASLDELITQLPSRNALLAELCAGLAGALAEFDARGLPAFIDDWMALDAYRGRRLRVRTAGGKVIAGIADGIGVDGGLLLRTRSGLHAVHSGTVVPARAA